MLCWCVDPVRTTFSPQVHSDLHNLKIEDPLEHFITGHGLAAVERSESLGDLGADLRHAHLSEFVAIGE